METLLDIQGMNQKIFDHLEQCWHEGCDKEALLEILDEDYDFTGEEADRIAEAITSQYPL